MTALLAMSVNHEQPVGKDRSRPAGCQTKYDRFVAIAHAAALVKAQHPGAMLYVIHV
jgi:hypothetical protein